MYVTYILLGPHYISRLIRNDDLRLATSINELLLRIFYLTYVSLLFSSYFFYNPNLSSWLLAIIINLVSISAYIIKWFNIRNTDPDYYPGIISHIGLILPIIIGYFYYDLNIKKIQFNKIIGPLLIMAVFLTIYFYVQNNLYTD